MSLRMRPRFTATVVLPPGEVLDRFRAAASTGRLPCRVDVMEGLAELSPRRRDQHVWSPYLKLVVDPVPGDDTVAHLDGRYGPNASLWTFFVALYAVAFICGGVALLWAYSQHILDRPPVALWGTGAAVAMAGAVWTAGQVGQRFAQEQMDLIHRTVHEVIGDAIREEHREG